MEKVLLSYTLTQKNVKMYDDENTPKKHIISNQNTISAEWNIIAKTFGHPFILMFMRSPDGAVVVADQSK